MSVKINYTRMVSIAYLYFGGLALAWLCTTWFVGHRYNVTALTLTVAYGLLFWRGGRIADLVAGIVSLFFSFFMLMDVLNTFDLLSKNADFGLAAKVLLAMSVAGIVMSVFLILSFTSSTDHDSKELMTK